MRIQIKNELLIINILSVILILVIWLLPDVQALRIILGLPFLLFFPGYALVAVLFPRKSDLNSVERVTFSFGLSIVIVALIGFLLNYIWAIRLYPMLVSLVVFIAIMSAIGWFQRRRFPVQERLDITFNLSLPRQERPSRLDRVIKIILLLVLLGAISTLSYVIVNPTTGEKFTEFYILGVDGEANGYPQELILDNGGDLSLVKYARSFQDRIGHFAIEMVEVAETTAKIFVGITNNEHRAMKYEVKLTVSRVVRKEIGPLELAHNQEWGEEISFAPQEPCGRTKLAEEINPIYGPVFQGPQSILVESAQYLTSDDLIYIGNERCQIHSLNGNIVTLNEPLKLFHPAGEEITETQKAELKLYKIHQLQDNETSLTLWLGKQKLNATVVNHGQNQANYELKVETDEEDSGENESVIGNVGTEVVLLNPGEEWEQELDYAFNKMEPKRVEFSLYKDGEVLYSEEVLVGYPAVHFWIDVKETKVGE